jgi:hypothetical protein
MANHFHLLLIPIDPDNIPLFVKYVKQELAHAVNRLRGRRRKTVWVARYDSPRIISYKKAIKYFSYIHLQPVAAGICQKDENYKGASSAPVRRLEKVEKSYHRRYRPSIEEEDKETVHTLVIEPLAWVKELAPEKTIEEVLREIDACMEEKREELIREKAKHGKGFHAEPIKVEDEQGIKKEEWGDSYVPSKHGIKMRVIGDNDDRRIRYICYLLRQEARCKTLYEEWKGGESVFGRWPEGFFMPAPPRRVRALPVNLSCNAM